MKMTSLFTLYSSHLLRLWRTGAAMLADEDEFDPSSIHLNEVLDGLMTPTSIELKAFLGSSLEQQDFKILH
ncbi:hypothetical protein EMCRGX_G023000 [Ephydatia muelleri]